MGCSGSSSTCCPPDPSPAKPETKPGRAEVFDEEDIDAAIAHDDVAMQGNVPEYWTNKQYVDSGPFNQLVYVDKDKQEVFDKLLNSTYLAISTRDRPCPKKTKRCDKQPQGCPCVQPDGDPGLPIGYRVRRVVRVENSTMWARYAQKRAEILSTRGGDDVKRFRPEALPSKITRASPEIFQPVKWRFNETYLWHGLDVRTALSIAQENFNIDLAGSGAGAMYGPGAYFAESITKADEYARDEPDGFYSGIHAALLCRVTMGKMYYTTKFGQEEAFEKVSKGWCDSVLGDLSKFRMTFREFVVYNADQVYPEYVVLYSRAFSKDADGAMDRLAQIPFHLELPVYWRNCHVAPRVKPFAQEYRVRTVTLDLLQRLVSSSTNAGAKLQSAYRIENSMMWNRFIDYKARARASCNGTGAKDVRTTQELRQLTGEAISIENLEELVNEHMLWYGTPQEAARGLAHGNREITEQNTNGGRFGQGAYLSDDLDKALSYATDEDGIKHVLLCRACCGRIYEIADENGDASNKARAGKYHSVLASLENEARTFVMLDNSQVYPEFILELKADDGEP